MCACHYAVCGASILLRVRQHLSVSCTTTSEHRQRDGHIVRRHAGPHRTGTRKRTRCREYLHVGDNQPSTTSECSIILYRTARLNSPRHDGLVVRRCSAGASASGHLPRDGQWSWSPPAAGLVNVDDLWRPCMHPRRLHRGRGQGRPVWDAFALPPLFYSNPFNHISSKAQRDT